MALPPRDTSKRATRRSPRERVHKLAAIRSTTGQAIVNHGDHDEQQLQTTLGASMISLQSSMHSSSMHSTSSWAHADLEKLFVGSSPAVSRKKPDLDSSLGISVIFEQASQPHATGSTAHFFGSSCDTLATDVSTSSRMTLPMSSSTESDDIPADAPESRTSPSRPCHRPGKEAESALSSPRMSRRIKSKKSKSSRKKSDTEGDKPRLPSWDQLVEDSMDPAPSHRLPATISDMQHQELPVDDDWGDLRHPSCHGPRSVKIELESNSKRRHLHRKSSVSKRIGDSSPERTDEAKVAGSAGRTLERPFRREESSDPAPAPSHRLHATMSDMQYQELPVDDDWGDLRHPSCHGPRSVKIELESNTKRHLHRKSSVSKQIGDSSPERTDEAKVAGSTGRTLERPFRREESSRRVSSHCDQQEERRSLQAPPKARSLPVSRGSSSRDSGKENDRPSLDSFFKRPSNGSAPQARSTRSVFSSKSASSNHTESSRGSRRSILSKAAKSFSSRYLSGGLKSREGLSSILDEAVQVANDVKDLHSSSPELFNASLNEIGIDVIPGNKPSSLRSFASPTKPRRGRRKISKATRIDYAHQMTATELP